jgi:type I restriction enzyme, S subunit
MLKLSALRPDGLDLRETKFIDVPVEIARRFSLHKGELLVCRSNAYEYVAKCTVVSQDEPNVVFPDTAIRVVLRPALLPEYACEIINTPTGRSFFQLNSRRAVGGMWKIGAEDIATFPIPVPPIDVQRKIVARAGSARSQANLERAAATAAVNHVASEIGYLLTGKTASSGVDAGKTLPTASQY